MKNTLLPSEKQLHRKFSHYGANAKLWMRKCILLLPEIEKHEIWKKKGFGSIYEYAAKLAGMNHEKVNEALRILKKIEDKPQLLEVAAEKGIGAVKSVATLATFETETFWAEKARMMSKHTLEIYAQEYRKSHQADFPLAQNKNGLLETKNPDSGRPGTAEKTHREVKNIMMELDPEIVAELQKLKGADDWNDLMKQLLHIRKQYLEEHKPEVVKTESRHIPVKIERHVLVRTNGQCAFPECKRSAVILHHTQRFALEKVHDPDRLQPLCKGHERIAHQGLIQNEDHEPSFWKLRQQPDFSSPKFAVDQIVNRLRFGAADG